MISPYTQWISLDIHWISTNVHWISPDIHWISPDVHRIIPAGHLNGELTANYVKYSYSIKTWPCCWGLGQLITVRQPLLVYHCPLPADKFYFAAWGHNKSWPWPRGLGRLITVLICLLPVSSANWWPVEWSRDTCGSNNVLGDRCH